MNAPGLRSSHNVTPHGESPSTTIACLTAVRRYSDVLQRVHRGDITHENAIDDWTTYVNTVGATPDGHNDDVAGVLSELYRCLLRFAPSTTPGTNGHHSPLGSSTHIVDEESLTNGRASSVRNRLRPSKIGANLSPHSLVQSGNPHAPFDADTSSPNPRRSSFRGGPHALGGSGIFASSIEAASPKPLELPEGGGSVNAPEEEALTGGLSDDECIGFRLE
jgi:hypothetical protein